MIDKSFLEIEKRQEDLYENTKYMKLIYLDLNIWIEFLKFLNNYSCRAYTKELFTIIKNLSEKNKIIIPISDITIYEILKNKNSLKFTAIINLFDELSKKFCFIDVINRDKLEFVFLLRILLDIPNAEYLLRKNILTRPIFILDTKLPYFDENLINEIQSEKIRLKYLSDMWEKSFSDLYLSKEFFEIPAINFTKNQNKIISILNEGREKYKNEYKNFERLLKIELYNTLDLYNERFKEYFKDYFYNYKGSPSNYGKHISGMPEDERVEFVKYSIVESMYKSKKYDVFPSLSIGASLHAIKRWKSQSKYHVNDLFDIYHAKVALPYCDYFFTERTLKNFLTDDFLKLDKVFCCEVIYDFKEAYEALSKLTN